ncbi:uncharacterized protein LOC110029428 isoform X2 [Phalaenopsis equestris]|uniref:uncharacterized protein LOC110029428 isoform X2 n=1 Tax=Phalaenopsis equestris TaxID=78828 RepID=UPI0009E2E064|nr:uncharacterized protein LOC110029428 isoform X2 [Phalaenopsis equestris]
MEKKQKILESRKRLDSALSLPDLVNKDSIASLVKEQFIQSSLRSNRDVGKIVENRTLEVENFLEMLRSASGSSSSHSNLQKDWKIKQDTDQLRVMYCEGPDGSPFHTLLAEGFADGPMDVCLCVSWESTLYKKWWPQYNVPAFKIIISQCLQKVRIGEEISLIRVKVPWPVSDREAVVHYFEIEYFDEDLVLVLVKTISDTEHIDPDTYGFSGDVIPQAKDTIRIDLLGGFVLQKVESNRCYFRAIFNFDIKLDFIPASLINFISRQLIGNGHKLYQKAVGSVATIDPDYRLALQGPLYVRIRQQLHTGTTPVTSSEGLEIQKPSFLNESKTGAPGKDNAIKARTSHPEITEEYAEGKIHMANGSSGNLLLDKHKNSSHEKASISPEVEHALGILDQVISMVRRQSIDRKPSPVSNDFPVSELATKLRLFDIGDAPENSSNKLNLNGTSSSIIEAGHNHAALSSPKVRFSDSVENSKTTKSKINFHEILPSKTLDRMMQLTPDGTGKVCDEESLKANEFHGRSGSFHGKTKKKRKKLNLSCLNPRFLRD